MPDACKERESNMWGSQIDRKFARDGRALNYPGNTVLADVDRGNPALSALTAAREIARAADARNCLIFLPDDSYHMTVIRALNHRVRTPDFWPEALPNTASMREADAYVRRAARACPDIGPIAMRFAGVRLTNEDLRVLAAPANAAQADALHRYRNAFARALGLFLPGHDEYTYHITLAYTRVVPEGENARALAAGVEQMEALLSREMPAFQTDAPHVAFYRDMLVFHREEIAR